jgi:hypothetical protein
MSNYQTRRSLSFRRPPENPDFLDDTDELVGGKTRVVLPRRSSLTSSSRAGSESLLASSPGANQTNTQAHTISGPPYSAEMSLAELSNVDTDIDSPMMERQNNLGHIYQSTSNFQNLGLQTLNDQLANQMPAHWHNNVQPFQNHYQQQPSSLLRLRTLPDDQQQMLAATDSSPSNWNMFSPQEISSFNGVSMAYPHQQLSLPPSPPTNDAHADWQYLLTQTLQD